MLKLSLFVCIWSCSFLWGDAATRNLKISLILIHCREATCLIAFKIKTKNNNISKNIRRHAYNGNNSNQAVTGSVAVINTGLFCGKANLSLLELGCSVGVMQKVMWMLY